MNDIVYLPLITITKDELGQIEENEEYTRMVFCEKKSVAQSEFFNAGQNGLKPQCMIVVFVLDYEEETSLKYKDTIYDIYRTYERNDERIELYCMEKAHE